MLKIVSTLCLPVAACGLALGVTACAAVPVAQMALSAAPAKTPCVTGTSCQPAAAGMSASLVKPFQNLFGAPTTDPPAADPPTADPKDAPPPNPKQAALTK